jgi:hypothetical protein
MRPFNTGFSCICALTLACGPGLGGTPDSGTPDSGTPDSGTPDSGMPDSGMPDSATPDSGGGLCSYTPSNVDLSKLDFTGVEDILISHDASIETGNGGLLGGASGKYTYAEIMQSNGLPISVFVVKSLTIPAGVTVTASGPDALAIVGLGDITIDGKLVGASVVSLAITGPGAIHQSGNTNAQGSGIGGGTGGSGGSSAGGGGYCGAGGDGAALSGAGSKGGASWGNATLVPLAAGSNGGTGGVGPGGDAGGAIQLSACGAVKITGVVNVGAEGGVGSGVYDSQNVISQQASGGGSGGSLLIEGVSVDLSGTLAANGGGGGGGTHGSDATADAQPAPGGTTDTQKAAGGDGAAGATIDGQAGKTQAASTSGGGGGAAGRIRINSKTSPTLGGTISPALGTCTTQGTL